MYEIIPIRTEEQNNITADSLAEAFKAVADIMCKEVSDLRYTDISIIGDKEDADWVVDYYGKIVAVIIKKIKYEEQNGKR